MRKAERIVKQTLAFALRFTIGFLMSFGVIFASQWIFYNYLDSYTLPDIVVPMEVLNENKTLKRGDALEYRITYTKPEDISPIKTIRQIVCKDGNLVTMTSVPARLPLAEEPATLISTSIVIPEKVSTGECRLELVADFEPNPYKFEERLFYSEWFNVIE